MQQTRAEQEEPLRLNLQHLIKTQQKQAHWLKWMTVIFCLFLGIQLISFLMAMQFLHPLNFLSN